MIQLINIPLVVRHANASHFWLNEGFTTYMERLLQGKLHSPAQRGFSYVIGYKDLEDALQGYKDRPKYQRLVIDFERGEDPDDAYSSVPYEKGANFLLHLGISFYCVEARVYLIKCMIDRTKTRRTRSFPSLHLRLCEYFHRQKYHN